MMVGILGLCILLTVLGLSLVITQLASVALTMTGLSDAVARFQARSAFTGTGFTTSEAEKIVNHPVRRRIIMGLMFLRSAGLVTVIVSLLLSFVGTGPGGKRLMLLGMMVGGVLVLWLLARSNLLRRFLERLMRRALDRWTDLPLRDYASLLNLEGDYSVTEMTVQTEDWLEGRTVEDAFLYKEGINLLALTRKDGSFVGVPGPETEFRQGDTLILYGRSQALANLGQRRKSPEGDREHRDAVREQADHDAAQRQQERKRRQESDDQQ